MANFLLCCVPTTYAGMFKAIAYTDLILNVLLLVAAGYSFRYEFHLNVLLYIILTLVFVFIVLAAIKNFYEKKTPNSKFQRFYSTLRCILLIVSIVYSYDTYWRSYLILDNYDGPHKNECLIFFSIFSTCLLIYLIYTVHWTIQLLKVTYGQRSGDDDEDSEEFLE